MKALDNMSNRELYEFAKNLRNGDRKLYFDLLKYGHDTGEDVNYALAQNDTTPKEILYILADTKKAYTLFRLTVNPNTPPEALEKIANRTDINVYDYGDVIRNIATHPNCPESLVKKFSPYLI